MTRRRLLLEGALRRCSYNECLFYPFEDNFFSETASRKVEVSQEQQSLFKRIVALHKSGQPSLKCSIDG